MDRYFSDELFHFVGRSRPGDHEHNYRVLKKILSEGCIAHKGPEAGSNSGWGVTSVRVDWSKTLVSQELIDPTIICVCDIPLEHLGMHLEKYSPFGLSLSKQLLIKHGARPVFYVPLSTSDKGSPFGQQMLLNVDQAYRGFHEHVVRRTERPRSRIHVIGSRPKSAKDAIAAVDAILAKDFLAFIKPFDSALGPDHQDNYYAEREWRKYGNQLFKPQDVRHIVVGHGYRRRFRREMPAFAATKVVEK